MKTFFKFLVLICLLLETSCASTQVIPAVEKEKVYIIKERIVDIQIDKLSNIYILNKENKVIKYTDAFQRQFDYSNNLIGEIKTIDATNPQKILCFVKDFNRILILDNTLAEINTIDLSTSEYLDVSAVARSNDDQIWLFDPINQALVKVNDLVEKQIESNRLTDLNLGMLEPVKMVERGNIVAMSDPDIGVLIFDNFGQFLRLIPIKGVYDFQIVGDYLVYSEKGRYYQFHLKRYEKTEVTGLIKGFSRIYIGKERTYYIDNNGVFIE